MNMPLCSLVDQNSDRPIRIFLIEHPSHDVKSAPRLHLGVRIK